MTKQKHISVSLDTYRDFKLARLKVIEITKKDRVTDDTAMKKILKKFLGEK